MPETFFGEGMTGRKGVEKSHQNGAEVEQVRAQIGANETRLRRGVNGAGGPLTEGQKEEPRRIVRAQRERLAQLKAKSTGRSRKA